jgi:NADH dehydrogenase
MNKHSTHHVLIIGGGFGGLQTARALAHSPVQITLIDRDGEHVFQPLLYQVATGSLADADITAPLAGVLARQKNARVITGTVTDINPNGRFVILEDGTTLPYDTLIVATGASHHYFGRDEAWSAVAPGLKTLEDAAVMRRRIYDAFLEADATTDLAERAACQTFVIVGGGPTGVELAGALGELAHHTLRGEFHNCDTADSDILLIEGLDRVLSSYPAELSAAAERSLDHLGVTVRTNTVVTEITDEYVMVRDAATGAQTVIPTRTVLWAAGVQASPLGAVLGRRAGAEQDRLGRVIVNADLTVPGYDNLFVIGDLAHVADKQGHPLPGVAQVAMQQGDYVADLLRRRRFGRPIRPFRYRDRGSLAVIGRNAAVADIGRLEFAGFPAFVLWAVIHIYFLIEFDDKIAVMSKWGWRYLTRGKPWPLTTAPVPTAPVSTAPVPTASGAPDGAPLIELMPA